MATSIEFNHPDLLNELNKKIPVSAKIDFIHRVVREKCHFIHRIGVAIYDAKMDSLKTFVHSTEGKNPLPFYQSKLSDAKSLYRIHLSRKPRLINDLDVFKDKKREHSQRIHAQGYRASYTVPMYHHEELKGFVFFNSRQPGCFQEESLPYLDMIARLITLLLTVEFNQVQTLSGALKTATCFSCHKDPETGEHLERMARFSRLIANEIAGEHGLDEQFVEAIFWFAPMHDIGKIAIPDRILLKPGPLTADEFREMKTHTTRGREMIGSMMENFNLAGHIYSDMIGNIAEYHHENVDGSGYPRGLKGAAIPLEARIVAVADVFDALTSRRVYKPAWSNEEAFAELRQLAGWKLDSDCVNILINQADKIREIQQTFQEKPAEQQAAAPATGGFSLASSLFQACGKLGTGGTAIPSLRMWVA